VLGAVSELGVLELSEVQAAVGSRSFERGRVYARGKRVLGVEWDPDGQTLSGTVVGHGAVYSTSAFFEDYGDGELVFEEGECTCPVGYNCKHVAAIVVAATDGRSAGRAGQSLARSHPHVETEAQPPAWEQPLLALVDAPAARATGNPLAIELALDAGGGPGRGARRLLARLMRPGARGGWVNGSLNWSGLDSWQVQNGGYRPDHLALVRELYLVYRAREGRPLYYYGYSGERTLELSCCESPQLWSLLDEAARLRLTLIHANPKLGEVRCDQDGEIVLNVTDHGEQGSLVAAVVRIDGEDAHELEPVLFLGSSGHGIVCAERADIAPGGSPESWRLRLVRLARPAAPQLQRMVLDREPLEVPASERDRFAEELCPALRHVAPVVSSDGSFTPPEIPAPTLVLRASYGAGHAVEAGWEWAYRVGDTVRRAALGANGGGPRFRDLDAERAILADTVLSGTGLERFGLLDQAGRPADSPVALTGLDSMRLTTEGLPQLERWPGIDVEVAGEPADYRDVGDSLAIGVSTAEVAGERDWFDLGVTISVEGRELPFAEVFVALARGESHMLLADGAHFSLLEPTLQELRRLIEEARSLSDSPYAPLLISRYQAGLWAELVALGVVTAQAEAWQRQVGALLELDKLAEHEPPATLAARLRPYQRDGFGWLASLWEAELGGILADDMGLGKTLQALALICHARARDPGVGAFLVVAPTSVVSGWAGEAARFAPGLRVETVSDTLARSGRTIAEVAAADVVVTTYTLLRLECDAYSTVDWAALILDEAQYVKNHQAKTYRCGLRLSSR